MLHHEKIYIDSDGSPKGALQLIRVLIMKKKWNSKYELYLKKNKLAELWSKIIIINR